jgi:hypothetical protein
VKVKVVATVWYWQPTGMSCVQGYKCEASKERYITATDAERLLAQAYIRGYTDAESGYLAEKGHRA